VPVNGNYFINPYNSQKHSVFIEAMEIKSVASECYNLVYGICIIFKKLRRCEWGKAL